jgi:A/G-specific adenine glycosylase
MSNIDYKLRFLTKKYSDSLLAALLLPWYIQARRDLPWRTPDNSPPPAYHVLVSEAMLQQTQVNTVIPYFQRFLASFPTIDALAASDEQDVLRLWQGLGYYSRARNLRKAAIAICHNHAGIIPRDVQTLLTLPGVGRYTAGAIASIACNVPAPIVDGNVVRVLCRLHAITDDPREPKIIQQLWHIAEKIVPQTHPGNFNSALMELGATVCTPRNPSCNTCPIRQLCQAYATQQQASIPRPKAARVTPLFERWVLCIRRPDSGWLVERRPLKGRWAGLWQFITLDHRPDNFPDDAFVVRHALTHRRYVFFAAVIDMHSPAVSHFIPDNNSNASGCVREWKSLAQMQTVAFSRPHLKIRDQFIT